MSNSSVSTFTPETTVGAIVAEQPGLARFFEHLGIDYCCDGKQTLAQSCAKQGLEIGTTIKLISSALLTLAGTTSTEPVVKDMPLGQLADHIEHKHHAYVKAELPRLLDMADKVADKHGQRDPRLLEVQTIIHTVAAEFYTHMQKEEAVLFPLARKIEAGAADALNRQMIAKAIQEHEVEHDSVGRAVDQLHDLTDKFTPDAEACNTQRELLSSLSAFSSDTHRHVHKENNILFPRMLAAATTG